MIMLPFLDYQIYSGDLIDINHKSSNVISTINPYSFLMAEKNMVFKSALQSSNIILPDGQGIVWAMNHLYGKKIKKIAGYDIFMYLLNQLQSERGSCFFLGSTLETLNKIISRLNKEYNNVRVDYYSPPFKTEFTFEDDKIMIDKINTFNPDVLFVGMTAPKQELWVHKNRRQIDAKVIVSIGAVFDFYAGNIKRPSKFWIDLGLEWFLRFLQEPRRLWKRNFVAGPLFVWKVLKTKNITDT